MRQLFVSANSHLRDMGFEIRTVMLRNPSASSSTASASATSSSSSSSSSSATLVTRYHSLINIEEDHVAREVGSAFTVEELKLFTKTIERLLWRRKMTTTDVVEVCNEGLAASERRKQTFLQELVGRWEEGQWLIRSGANLLEIGPRTHLELRHLLETYADHPTEEDEREERSSVAISQSLPQIIIHG